jgi:alpha-glucosidase
MPDGPRPHRHVGVPNLADLPLDRGTTDIRVERARTTGPVNHGATIESWIPLIEGLAPERPSPVLAFPLTHAPTTCDEARVDFEWDGTTLRAQVPWALGTDAYGLGQQVGPLRRNGRGHQLWNTDAWCYGDETPALYQSHPWVLALKPDGRALGILAETSRRLSVTVADDGVEFAVEGEPCEVHLIDGAGPGDVLRALAAMTGTIARPPRWALGYHQCRWSYESEGELRAIAARLRAEAVPCDALWFDIDYMDRFRVFTWDPKRFPDPRGLTRDLEDQGFHSVAIVDPGVALADDYEVCADGLAGRHFVEDAQGRPVRGRVWPGVCHFPDFTRPATREWWAGLIESLVRDSGLHGLWNDMNEPSLFRTAQGTLPDDAHHRGLGGGSHGRFHNLYGQLMSEATLDGVRAARPEARPFVLTRAAHLSTARHAATWTGDNQSRWEDLRWAVPMVLGLGLSGQPFSGPDLGGFFGAPDGELFVRWFELGAYLPFCRGHSEKTSPRKEPWSFGPRALAQVRAALEERMRILPTLVSAFEVAAREGLPVCRPLWWLDPNLRRADDVFLLGTDLLVAPVLEQGATSRRVPLPANPGGWFPRHVDGPASTDGEVTVPAPLGTCPTFARAGSILVEAATRQHTGQADDERTWNVYLDDQGRARAVLFEDQGEGLDGPVLERVIEAQVRGDQLDLWVADRGDLAQPERLRRVRVHGWRPGVLEAEVPLGPAFSLSWNG